MKRSLLALAAVLLGYAGAYSAQGPSVTHHYSARLEFDPLFADGEQVVIHARPGTLESPAILWLSGRIDPGSPLPRPLPKLALKRIIRTSTGSDTVETEASLNVYGEYFGCALDLGHKDKPPAANETYEIYIDGRRITTLRPAWIASWTFDPALEAFFALQRRQDGQSPTIQLRTRIIAHPTKSGSPQSVELQRDSQTANATENAGTYSALLAANGAPKDPRLFIKVRGIAGVAGGVVPWVQTGPLVFILGDHGTHYFRARAGATNVAELSPRDDEGRPSQQPASRCWYWDGGASRWLRSTGIEAASHAAARYFLDGWRAAAGLMAAAGGEAGAIAAGFVFVEENFPPLIDPSQWDPGLSTAPINPSWAPPNDLRIQLGEPSVVIWCVGRSDAQSRTWKVIFDPAAHANEASEEYLNQLRDALTARIILWTSIPTVQPQAKLPQHVVIPPPDAFRGALKFDSADNPGVASRIGAQTVQNALSSPKAAWISVVPPPTIPVDQKPEVQGPAFNGIRAYSLGWALGLQYPLPAGP